MSKSRNKERDEWRAKVKSHIDDLVRDGLAHDKEELYKMIRRADRDMWLKSMEQYSRYLVGLQLDLVEVIGVAWAQRYIASKSGPYSFQEMSKVMGSMKSYVPDQDEVTAEATIDIGGWLTEKIKNKIDRAVSLR